MYGFKNQLLISCLKTNWLNSKEFRRITKYLTVGSILLCPGLMELRINHH